MEILTRRYEKNMKDDERIEIMYKLEKILAHDLPITPLFHEKNMYLVNTEIKNIRFYLNFIEFDILTITIMREIHKEN